MNNLDQQYQNLLQDILDNGVKKGDRTGTGTISVFGRTIRHKMSDGFPLLTTKKMAWKGIVTEMLWFLRGDTNIKYLVEHGNNIWTGDAYKNYMKNFTRRVCPPTLDVQPEYYEPMTKEIFVKSILDKTDRGREFAEKWGELGPIYGKQWRKWQGWMDIKDVHPLAKGSLWYDQIARLIHDLRTNPDSRRLMVNAWNVAEIDDMVLPPCHYGFQVYTRELSIDERYDAKQKTHPDRCTPMCFTFDEYNKFGVPNRAISLKWNQRSVDTFLGLPFNIASYGLLLEMLAKEVNMVPDELIGDLGDTHLYLNHIDQAKEQISREPYQLPKLAIDPENVRSDANIQDNPHGWDYGDFQISDYQSHPTIKAELSN